MLSLKKTTLAGLCVLTALGTTLSNANATVFAGTATFADTTTNNALNVTDYKSPLAFQTNSLTATTRTDCGVAGNCRSFTGFMTLETTDTSTAGNNTRLTDNISLMFTWTSPSSATDNKFVGTVLETIFKEVKDDNGSLTWVGDTHYDKHGKYAEQKVIFADGAQIAIDVYDAGLDGSTSALAGQFDIQICDLQDPTAVAEPASVAMLGVGMISMGMITRRRRSSTTAPIVG